MAHAIMLDFDEGFMTTDELLDLQQNKWQYASYVYSSQNHNKPKTKKDGSIIKPCDRLRVLIPLKDPIDNEFDRQAVRQALIAQYNSNNKPVLDESFMDRARYFAHGTTDVSSFISGRGLFDWTIIPNLHQSQTVGRPSKARELKQTFRLDDEVTDANGGISKVSELAPNTSIYCPRCGTEQYRHNESHNAVLMINEDNIPFIFCSSCQSRNMGVGGKGVYNLHPDDIYKLKYIEKDALVFINTLNSKYFGLCKEPGIEGRLVRELSTLEHAKQFCKYHGLNIPDTFPRARYELVFNSDKVMDIEIGGYINRYNAPLVLKNPVSDNYRAKYPISIARLIHHVFAHDKEIIERFINDLAYTVQKRKKLITAYLVQGTEGTGKNLMFSLIIQQIFGQQYCTQTDMDAFGSQFNSFLTENVFALISEVSGNFSSNERKNLNTTEKMKIAISDESLQIESKGRDRINGKNYCSLIFATNRAHGVVLSKDDRRFNVAPRQEQKISETLWWHGYNELKEKIAKEIQEFVWYLKQVEINHDWIGSVVQNEPKELLQTLSSTNADDFFEAFKSGDIEWFENNHPAYINTGSSYSDNDMTVSTLIDSLNDRKGLTMQELYRLYSYINNRNIQAPAFTKMATSYLGKTKSFREDSIVKRGYAVAWKQQK